MPNPIDNNSRVLANRIVSDAKAAGLSPSELQDLGKSVIARFSQANVDVAFLPAIRDHATALANALTMAATELAANTAPDPFVDGGVTA